MDLRGLVRLLPGKIEGCATGAADSPDGEEAKDYAAAAHALSVTMSLAIQMLADDSWQEKPELVHEQAPDEARELALEVAKLKHEARAGEKAQVLPDGSTYPPAGPTSVLTAKLRLSNAIEKLGPEEIEALARKLEGDS